jgi:hypothetical protein
VGYRVVSAQTGELVAGYRKPASGPEVLAFAGGGRFRWRGPSRLSRNREWVAEDGSRVMTFHIQARGKARAAQVDIERGASNRHDPCALALLTCFGWFLAAALPVPPLPHRVE